MNNLNATAGFVVPRRSVETVRSSATNAIQLLVDASGGGDLSATRVHLANGENGAGPHIHRRGAELFFVISGSLQLLLGEEVVTAEAGDTVLVPPETVHAFGALAGCDADVLIVLAPSAARATYFRLLERVHQGLVHPRELLASQELHDTYFAASDVWRDLRNANH